MELKLRSLFELIMITSCASQNGANRKKTDFFVVQQVGGETFCCSPLYVPHAIIINVVFLQLYCYSLHSEPFIALAVMERRARECPSVMKEVQVLCSRFLGVVSSVWVAKMPTVTIA